MEQSMLPLTGSSCVTRTTRGESEAGDALSILVDAGMGAGEAVGRAEEAEEAEESGVD